MIGGKEQRSEEGRGGGAENESSSGGERWSWGLVREDDGREDDGRGDSLVEE